MNRFLRYALLLVAVALVADVPAQAYSPWSPSSGVAASNLLQNGGVPWVTLLDLDFTAQGSQTLTTDGSVTIAGKTWTKFNTAHERSAATLGGGAGLALMPAAGAAVTWAANNTRTTPGIFLPFSQLTFGATLTTNTPIRVWTYQTGSSGNNNSSPGFLGDGVMVGVINSAGLTATAEGHLAWMSAFAFSTQVNGLEWDLQVANNGTATGSGSVITSSTFTFSSSSMVLELPRGMSSTFSKNYWGNAASPWPAFSAMVPISETPETTVNVLNGLAGIGSCCGGLTGIIMPVNLGNFGVVIQAGQGSTHTVTDTVSRIRIDYQPSL